MDNFVAGIERGKYKALRFAARLDRPQAKSRILKERVHFPIRNPATQQFNRQKQQERKENESQKSEFQQSLANFVVIGRGGLVRRKIIRIDRQQIEPIRMRAAVDDPQPDRLNMLPRHRYAEEFAAFYRIEHRYRHFQIGLRLRLRAAEKLAPSGDGV